MASITLTPSKIGDVRRYYKRVRTVGPGGTTDNTTYSNNGRNYVEETYAIAGTKNLSQKTSTSPQHGTITTTTCWQQRMLVAFDLSGIEGTITAAKLRFYPATGDYSGNLKSFAIRRNTAAWNPATVTWNNQPANTSAGEKSAQFPSQKWTEVDVTAMVLADSGNYGFVVYNDDLDNHARFFAKTGSLVPQLIVTYTPYNSKIKTKPTTLPIDGETAGTVTIERYNSAYTHKLQVKLGSETQTFTDIDTTQTFTLPSSWLSQIPNATSGSATLTLWTYDAAGNQVGTTDVATFSATVPASIVPSVTASVEIVNSNPTVSGWGILLQSFSQIKMTAAGTAGTGATIASFAFSGAGMAQTGAANVCTSGVIQNSGTLTATVKLTDSRGRQATASIDVTVYPYATPSISDVALFRCTQDGTRDDVGGTYLSISGLYSCASANGHNSKTVLIRYQQNGASAWTTGVANAQSSTVYVFGNGEIDITKAYNVQIVNTDALGNATIQSNVINQVIAALSLGLKNDRARFGGPVRKPGLEIDWDTRIHGILTAPNLPNRNLLHNWDFRHPVNQRGASSYTGARYGIDRWYVASSSVTAELVSDGVKFTNSGDSTGYIRQWLEYGTPDGEYCFTIFAEDSTSSSNTMYFGYSDNTFSSSVPIAAGYNSVVSSADKSVKRVQINICAGASVTLIAAKLERGNFSTLAYDAPSDYGEQLGLCQRYYVSIDKGQASGILSNNGTDYHLYFPLPVAMRLSKPTLESGAKFMIRTIKGYSAATGNAFTVLPFTVYETLSSPNCVSISYRASVSDGATNNTPISAFVNNVAFSADL